MDATQKTRASFLMKQNKLNNVGKALRYSALQLQRISAMFSFRKLMLTMLTFLVIPGAVAYAGFFSFFGDLFSVTQVPKEKPVNSQNMNLLEATLSPLGEHGRGGSDMSVVGGVALLADAGPSGALPDVDEVDEGHGDISIYEVRDGDSLASIAKMYDVSVNTILWANNMKKGATIKVGQTLVILPVTGVQHTVVAGDSVEKIAKKYKGDVDEIRQYNQIGESDQLAVGMVVIVPDGEIVTPTPAKKKPATSKLRGSGGPSYSGFYLSPLAGYKKTQGLHGYNGVDLASYVGAPITAAADGDVIVSRQGGYNGGYGNYVVLRHENGTQTLYAHMLSTAIQEGAHVTQGQIIGYLGNSGRSTGPHLHFEVRGARNPFQ